MEKTVSVIGLGRVGLPFALFLAHRGCTVHGIDNNPAAIVALREGRLPFREEGGQEALDAHLGSRFFAGEDLSAVSQVETIVITLGTPVDDFNNPIFLPIENLLRAMGFAIAPSTSVQALPTSPDGTENYFVPHPASLFLITPDGLGRFQYGFDRATPTEIAEDLRRLMELEW